MVFMLFVHPCPDESLSKQEHNMGVNQLLNWNSRHYMEISVL